MSQCHDDYEPEGALLEPLEPVIVTQCHDEAVDEEAAYEADAGDDRGLREARVSGAS